MNELDLMAADRDNTMTVKRQGFKLVEDIKKDQLGRNMTTKKKFEHVRELVETKIREPHRE